MSSAVTRGWYSCFKNNNYLFVRSCAAKQQQSDGDSPWYRNYDILNSKLHISLNQESKSGPVQTDVPVELPMPATERLLAPLNDVSPENENARFSRKGPQSWLRKLRTPRKTPRKQPSPEKECVTPDCAPPHVSLQETGPHTSTPKDDSFVDYSDPTPKRPLQKGSVRRRLPFRLQKDSSDLLEGLSPFKRRAAARRSLRDISQVTPLALVKRASMGSKQLEAITNNNNSPKEFQKLPETETKTCSDPVNQATPSEEQHPEPCNQESVEKVDIEQHSEKDVATPMSVQQMPKDEDVSEEGPVNSWLREVRVTMAGECLNALQAKLIATQDKSLVGAILVGNAQETAEKIWSSGLRVIEHLQLGQKILQNRDSESPDNHLLKFCTYVNKFRDVLREFISSRNQDNQKHLVEDLKMDQAYSQFKRSCSASGNMNPEWRSKTLNEISTMEKSFKQILGKLLVPHLKVIVDQLEQASGSTSVKRAIYAIILLGKMFGKDLCRLLAELDVVRSLMLLCIEEKWRPLRASALRALTVVCCCSCSVQRLVECDGFDCITEILCDSTDSSDNDTIAIEAVSLVVQCTAPWSEVSQPILAHEKVRAVGPRLVQSLTDLSQKTSSSEMFLVVSAALANLSLNQEAVTEWMIQSNTIELLTTACRNKKDVASMLFVMDQVSSIVANCSGYTSICAQIAQLPSVLVSLLCFLQVRPCVGHSSAEVAASERVQQKAAVAIAKICSSYPEAARDVADMLGVHRLVKLCKSRKERNDSDCVLVACLTALKQIASVLGEDEMDKFNATDLVKHSLWDTFIIHSSKQESYV